MSDGWLRVNEGSADKWCRGMATGGLPVGSREDLEIEFTRQEVVPVPVDAFVATGR
jgi:hypothetical protein